jgi:hypothetical protein
MLPACQELERVGTMWVHGCPDLSLSEVFLSNTHQVDTTLAAFGMAKIRASRPLSSDFGAGGAMLSAMSFKPIYRGRYSITAAPWRLELRSTWTNTSFQTPEHCFIYCLRPSGPLHHQHRLHQALHTTFCEVPFFLPLNPQPI